MLNKIIRFLNTPVQYLFRSKPKQYYRCTNPDLRFIKVPGVYTLVYYAPGDTESTIFKTRSKEEAAAFLMYAYSLGSKGLSAQIVFECYK